PRGPGSESEPILLAKPLVRGDEVGTAAADARPTSPNGTPSGVSLKMLLDHSMLSPSQYALVLEWEKAEGELIFDRIVATGFVDERALLRFIAGTSGYKYITG